MEESGLFELIKTLGKSEKRYFKKYAAAHGSKDPHTIALFDALEKPKEYDDAAFKKQYSKQAFFKNLASEKQHLMRVLLQSLREFHRNRDSRARIHFYMDCFELLFEKRQYKLAEKNLVKAMNLCRRYYHLSYLPAIYRSMGKLFHHAGNKERLKWMLDELNKEKRTLTSHVQVELEQVYLEYHSFYTSRTVGYPRTQKQRAVYDNLYKSLNQIEYKDKNLKEALGELLIANFYHDTFADKKPLLKVRRAWIELADKHAEYIADNSMQYLVSLNNLANSYDELGMQPELAATLDKMMRLPKKSLDEEVRTFIYYYNLKLVGQIINGDFTACVTSFPQVESGMHKLWRWFQPEYKLSFWYLFAYGYFGEKKYQLALKWTNEILVNYPKITLEEYYNFARLFILVIYYDLGYDGLLASELRSANRYFNKKKKLFALENTLLSFMKSALKPEGILSTKVELQQLHKDISQLKDDPYEKQLFSLFDWESWSESKLTGRSFSETVKKKAQAIQ